jgi:hypothetical protein
MPLPYNDTKIIDRKLRDLFERLSSTSIENRKTLDSEIIEELTQCFCHYVELYKPKLEDLYASGLVTPRSNRSYYIRGFRILEEKVYERIHIRLPECNTSRIKFVLPVILEEKIVARETEIARIEQIWRSASALWDIVKCNYGSIKYMLTQFPELKQIIAIESNWKPNPHYKVKPRSSFDNPDAFIKLFGECAMFGIKP